MKKILNILLPLFFVLFPFFHFIIINVGEYYSIGVIFIFALVFSIGTLLLYALLRHFFPTNFTQSCVALCVIYCFTFRELGFGWAYIGGGLDFRLVYIFVGFLAFGGLYFFRRQAKKISNIVIIGFLVAYSVDFVNFIYYSFVDNASVDEVGLVEAFEAVHFQHFPNIYYFVLDNYGNEDVLRNIVGYDNSGFIRSLENLGFYNIKDSTSNAGFTLVSMAMTLNQDYIDLDFTKKYKNERIFTSTWQENRTFREFRANGYSVYTTSDYPSKQDIQLKFPDTIVGETAATFISKTPFRRIFAPFIVSMLPQFDEFKLYQNLFDSKKFKAPFFFLGHIMSFHPPYSYDDNCNILAKYGLQNDYSLTGYINSLKCGSTPFFYLVQGIIKNDPNAVVIVQSDHGSMTRGQVSKDYVDWDTLDFVERFNNMFLIKLPVRCQHLLTKRLSNVNTFRLLRACLSDQQPEFLQDKYLWFPYLFKNYTPIKLDFDVISKKNLQNL